MKGKAINNKKVVKLLLLVLSFLLTIVLTVSITLAWFYDSDWANKTVTMAGSVGIHIEDKAGTLTHGGGAFHFKLADSTVNGNKAYPGQAIEVEAKVVNDGGSSVSEGRSEGSSAYIRARFVIYTDIGAELTGETLETKYPVRTAPSHPGASATESQLQNYYTQVNQYQEYLEYEANRVAAAQEIYESLVKMVVSNNTAQEGYDWVFFENTQPTVNLDNKDYFEGKQQTAGSGVTDGGYFYLCYDNKAAGAPTGFVAGKTLMPLPVGTGAAFLWDGTYIIPWQLTNLSADKTIFVAVEFQAIQTYVPKITVTDNKGSISGAANNQLPAKSCYYNDISIQTIFNSSRFTNYEELTTDDEGVVYSSEANKTKYVKASLPESSYASIEINRGTAQANEA